VCCTIPVDTGTLSAKPNPTIPQFRLKCAVSRSSGMALNAAEHIRITLDHGFGDGLHVLVIATDGGDLVL